MKNEKQNAAEKFAAAHREFCDAESELDSCAIGRAYLRRKRALAQWAKLAFSPLGSAGEIDTGDLEREWKG